MSYEQMTSRLAIMMGGRVAEELVFGHDKVTSGAASDIEQATRLAKMMVTRWGFSSELGQVAYARNQDEVFLGMSMQRHQNIFRGTAQLIDKEGAPPCGRRLCRGHPDPDREARGTGNPRPRPAGIRNALGDEIVDLLDGKPPVRDTVIEPANPRGSAVPTPVRTARAGRQRPVQPHAAAAGLTLSAF